jgi:nitroimidazol reductase NimA-like FMN-containing flavoprotein (pyridoxamine 5'-phosphate oxidase superfamily)
MHAILDAGRVAHVSITDDGQPFGIPVAYGRDGDDLLFHGSTGSRLFRALADGAPCCVTVTLLDGLVLAKSAFASSMNYRCVMALGVARRLDDDESAAALRRINEHLMPGRWADVRKPSRKELAATLVLALPLDECSVKVSAGPPEEEVDDVASSIWSGVVPIIEVLGRPVTAPDSGPDQPVPSYVDSW